MSSGNSIERRHFGRRDSSISATVQVRGRTSLTCTLLNYSATGALIEFREAAPTAQMFHLVVTEKNINLLCQVRHRTPKTLGVAFVGGSIEQFIDAFRPQPLPPAERPFHAMASKLETPPVASGAAENGTTAPTPPATAATSPEAVSESPAAARLEDLYALLEAIPEFTEAGFRMEASETTPELAIYHRAIRRGMWHESEGLLVWLPTGIGLETIEAQSAERAALYTMQMILALLQRRRRAVASLTDPSCDLASAATAS